MLQLFYKQKGAITVFLTLILVPIIVVCSCFIDLSRVRLAQGMINSAGDLAMNTAMTSFDKTLNEVYGLLASCQSKDEVVDSVNEYFIQSLSAQGIEENEIEKFVKSLNNLLGKAEVSNDISDLLNITMSDGSFALDEVTNGNLTNPAVIKEQIVNFMKYRSVIDGTQKIVKKIKGIVKQTKNIKENTEMVEAQQEAAEKEEIALDKLKSLYDEILNYQKENITKEYIEEIKNKLKEIKDNYKEAHNFTVKNILNYDASYMKRFDYSVKTDPDISLNGLGINKYKTALVQYNKALYDYMRFAYFENDNLYDIVNSFEKTGCYPWQYFMQLYKKLHDTNLINSYVNNYINKADQLCEKYKRLKKIKKNIDENGGLSEEEQEIKITLKVRFYTGSAPYYNSLPLKEEEVEKSLDEWYDYFLDDDIYNDKLKKDFSDTGLFGKLRRDMKNYIQTLLDEKTNTEPYDTKIKSIYNIMNDQDMYREKLIKAKNILDEVYRKAENAKTLVQNYENSVEDWKTKVEHSSSEFADKQREMLDGLENPENNDIYKKITKDRLDKFCVRVDELKNNIQLLINALNNMKYGTTKIKNIQDYKKFKRICKEIIGSVSIPIKENELNDLCENSFQSSSGFQGDFPDISWVDERSPELSKSAEPDKPEIYKDLEEQFGGNKKENEEKKKEYENYKEKAKNETDSSTDDSGTETSYVTCVNTQIKEKSDLPSQGKGALIEQTKKSTNIGEAGAEAGNLFNQLQGFIKNLALNCRDQLFVTDYIMSMFTYDTYTNEHLCKIAKEVDNRWNGKLNTTKEILKSASSNENIKEVWENEDKLVTDNKTITNQLLNINNNYSYGNEVEYILYGGTNEINKLKSWGIISAIQFSMNTIYGFSTFWSMKTDTGEAINILADAIYTATLGVVPPAVSKVVIILALVVAETVHDILCLKAGMSIALIKDEYTWACSLENGVDQDGYDPDASDTLKLTYSEYLMVFLFIAQLNAETAENIYLRTADVIQVNMQYRLKRDGEENKYLLKNSCTYYKLKAKFEIHPLMLKLPIVLNSGLSQGNPKDDNNWYTISYETIRGYY